MLPSFEHRENLDILIQFLEYLVHHYYGKYRMNRCLIVVIFFSRVIAFDTDRRGTQS